MHLLVSQKHCFLCWNWRGMEEDNSIYEFWAALAYEQKRGKHTYLRGKVFTDNYYLLTVIAYNQIDVIILRQRVTETAVTIRALTSSNTKHDDMAVSRSSSLSSCPTEKGGCAYISTPLIKLLKAELKPSAMTPGCCPTDTSFSITAEKWKA